MKKVRENVPLAPLTTFGVGGVARFFMEVTSFDDVITALGFAKRRDIKIAILGGGSNMLVPDDGVDGLVLLMKIKELVFREEDGHVLVSTGAGTVWDDFVREAVLRGFAGVECLSGVPGTVGGAVVTNIGAYGVQASDVLVKVEAIDREDNTYTKHTFDNASCEFSYHDSIFARSPERYIITEATFALRSGSTAKPDYEDYRFNLASHFQNNDLTLNDIREAILDIREEKGTLIMDGRLSYKTSGSFFHMPYVSEEEYAYILKVASEIDSEKEKRLRPWAWEQSDGSFKIAPGFLLEYTEFQKGYKRGAVGISPKHTLSIINIDDATARDVLQLAHDMQKAVEKIFRVNIEREVDTFFAK